jgi:hypothetical protein
MPCRAKCRQQLRPPHSPVVALKRPRPPARAGHPGPSRPIHTPAHPHAGGLADPSQASPEYPRCPAARPPICWRPPWSSGQTRGCSCTAAPRCRWRTAQHSAPCSPTCRPCPCRGRRRWRAAGMGRRSSGRPPRWGGTWRYRPCTGSSPGAAGRAREGGLNIGARGEPRGRGVGGSLP